MNDWFTFAWGWLATPETQIDDTLYLRLPGPLTTPVDLCGPLTEPIGLHGPPTTPREIIGPPR